MTTDKHLLVFLPKDKQKLDLVDQRVKSVITEPEPNKGLCDQHLNLCEVLLLTNHEPETY